MTTDRALETRTYRVETHPAKVGQVSPRSIELRTKIRRRWRALAAVCMTTALSTLSTVHCGAQLLLSDDFTGVDLDTTKWRIDSVPFESGTSDIAPTVGGGYLTF